MTPNTKKLLVILAALMGVQFVAMPLINWQGGVWRELQANMTALSARSDLVASADRLRAIAERGRNNVEAIAAGAIGTTQQDLLATQDKVLEELKVHSLAMRSFQWVTAATNDQGNVAIARLEIRGALQDVIAWQSELPEETPRLDVRALSLNIDPRSPEMTVSGDVVVAVLRMDGQ